MKVFCLSLFFLITLPSIALANARVLIVPGHDNEYWGTQYRSVKEADLTFELANRINYYITKYAQNDIEPIITRDKTGYAPFMQNYFTQNATDTREFMQKSYSSMQQSLANGSVKKVVGVPHVVAKTQVLFRLYSINNWVNNNAVDLVLHIHFNDNPTRPHENPGPLSGITLYVPDAQYKNSSQSFVYATKIFDRLHSLYATSSFPVESAGIVPDQDLIAVGANNSLSVPSILIEYGYIYEPQFLDPTIRSEVLDDMAYQTFLGLQDIFSSKNKTIYKFGTPLLPYSWDTNITRDLFSKKYNNNQDVLALQAGLRYLGLYTSVNKKPGDMYDCTLSGIWNPCTSRALKLFQKQNNLDQTGTLGTKTRRKLNAIFSI
jgi:N-acetylmuramoyl-L-alanine amidase